MSINADGMIPFSMPCPKCARIVYAEINPLLVVQTQTANDSIVRRELKSAMICGRCIDDEIERRRKVVVPGDKAGYPGPL